VTLGSPYQRRKLLWASVQFLVCENGIKMRPRILPCDTPEIVVDFVDCSVHLFDGSVFCSEYELMRRD
jgi:hypothetical protein